MKSKFLRLADALYKNRTLSTDELVFMIEGLTDEGLSYISEMALETKKKFFSDEIYIRGLIEISNICKNDCLYCGIRKSNEKAVRYRLTHEEILSCCKNGYSLGFRTFVLQGGEDGYFTDDRLCPIISDIKKEHPHCAVTLSMGERTRESYERLFEAGADRYLLRHETSTAAHYEKLHPKEMSFENRMKCLETLKSIGYQTGCGFMVGSPYQTAQHLARDIKFIEQFKPHMVGLGPFIPHCDTPFAEFKSGSLNVTLLMLCIIRLMLPSVLLPATTALATLSPQGRSRGLLCGANVVMPNLSPTENRSNYSLYNNKAQTGAESAEGLLKLKTETALIGQRIVISRGDYKKNH